MTRRVKKIITEDIDDGMNAFLEAAERLGDERVTIRENGQPVEVPMNEVVLRRLSQEAAKGSAHAMSQWNTIQAQVAEQKRKERDDLVAYWAERKRKNSALYEAHQAKFGCDPIDVFPHPDDIIFDEDCGVRIVGPIDAAAHKDMLRTKRFMAAYLLQDELDRRHMSEKEAEEPRTALIFYLELEKSLPERERLSDRAICRSVRKSEIMTKRDLLREVFQAWQALGQPRKRGALSPPGTAALEYLKLIYQLGATNLDKGLSEHRRAQLVDTWHQDFVEFALSLNEEGG